LRIHDIFVGIWIRGSMPLSNGSGFVSGILLFSSLTFKMPPKINLKKSFFCLLLFEGTVHLHHFSKIRSKKEVTKQQESMIFLLFLLGDRRIRINTSD
jgi:hypothetical protein